MKLYQPHQKGEFWFHKKVSSAWTDLCFVRFENPQREEHCCSFTKNGWNFRFRFDDIGKEFELSRFGIGLLTIMLFQDNTSDQKVLEMVKEEAYRELPRLEVIYDDKHGKTVCLSCEDSNTVSVVATCPLTIRGSRHRKAMGSNFPACFLTSFNCLSSVRKRELGWKNIRIKPMIRRRYPV